MKLYAKVTSERATKGQGGNKQIVIDLMIENPNRKRMTMLQLNNYDDRFELSIMRGGCSWEVIATEYKTKGEKQKGE